MKRCKWNGYFFCLSSRWMWQHTFSLSYFVLSCGVKELKCNLLNQCHKGGAWKRGLAHHAGWVRS